TWKTNEVSDSQVDYGATASYGQTTALNTALVTSHSIDLPGLTANTIYHFRVRSNDASGNLANSSDYSFATPPISSHGIPLTTGWYDVPNTHLRSVCPPDDFNGSGYSFNSACYGVLAAWNSAVMDTTRNRLVIWGGGQTDYLGNEVYALDLNLL